MVARRQTQMAASATRGIREMGGARSERRSLVRRLVRRSQGSSAHGGSLEVHQSELRLSICVRLDDSTVMLGRWQ